MNEIAILKRYKNNNKIVLYVVKQGDKVFNVTPEQLLSKYRTSKNLFVNAHPTKSGFVANKGYTIETINVVIMAVTTEPGISKVDAYCDLQVPTEFLCNSDGKLALAEIDKARIIDKNIGTCVTPFGATNRDNLSSGCKTALICIYAQKTKQPLVINLTSSGNNAVRFIYNYLYSCLKNGEVQYAIPCINYTTEVFKNKDALFLNKKTGTLGTFIEILGEAI